MNTREDGRQIVREGVISAVYPERHSARVNFQDKDGLESAELPLLNRSALRNKDYSLFDVGDTVVCLFSTNAEANGEGWIVGARYTEESPPVVASQDIKRFDFDDGTWIQYDRASNELRIECTGNVVINAKKIYLNEE